jgi:sulfotransferase family protein
MHFCITGTGRCGTKLLRNIFNAHPHIYVYDETHWIPRMFEFFGTGEAKVDSLIEIIRHTYHVTGVRVTELNEAYLTTELAGRTRMTVAEFCDILGNSLARRHGKMLWADKTPDYGPHLQSLQLLWPKCRIVHITRHGLEVAMSMSRHPAFRWMVSAREMWWESASFNHYYQMVGTVKQPFMAYIELWYWRLLRIRNEATRLNPGSYLEVKLEDLVKGPEDTLRKIAAFVAVSAPEDWLNEAVNTIDIDRIHCHAADIPSDGLESQHRELLTTLGYDIPPILPDISPKWSMRKIRNAIREILP